MNAGFLEAFERINRVSAEVRHLRPLPPTVTTITFAGKLDRQDVPVEGMRVAAMLAEELGEADGLEFVVDDPVSRAGAGGFASSSRRFKYQLPLRRQGKSVKVFHNGSVHATGCTSPLEFLETMAALVEFVRDTVGVEVRLVDFDVHLINALFLVTCPATGRPLTVAPNALMDALEAEAPRQTNSHQHAPTNTQHPSHHPPPEATKIELRPEFDPERHPSVKIAVLANGHRKATACVFQTGSVSIMGARDARYMAEAFEVACRAVESVAATACAPDPARILRHTTAKHALYLDDGYPFNLKACCMRM